jgi:hypothetical protein
MMADNEVTPEVIENLKDEESSEEIFDRKIVEEVENTETPPSFQSEEWSEFLIRQFREDELKDGNPSRDGLIRLTETYIGPIFERLIVNFTPPNKENLGTATVHSRMRILVRNESHPLFQEMITEDGIAEVNASNTGEPFILHPSATASSKAESQILRKVLRLRNTVAAEEVTSESGSGVNIFMPESIIAPEEITVIDIACKRVNMSVLDYIACGDVKYLYIEELPSSKAQAMIKFLNDIQSQKKAKPVEKPYDPAWREKNEKRRRGES